jgi:hypothetical protein
MVQTGPKHLLWTVSGTNNDNGTKNCEAETRVTSPAAEGAAA